MNPVPNKQKVILFIDDEKICHTLVELIIPNFTEYKLVGAFNGKEAIMLAKRYSKELSLVLSDIMLPDINGYEVYDALHKDPRFANIPFVFQSGLEAQEKELRKNMSEDVKILYKPYKQEELLKIIKETV
ncbi:MAG: response regulator [Pseudomonadota bacterium]